VADENPQEETNEENEELEEVETSMAEGEPEEEETQAQPVVRSDDEYYGTGRRKESVARVWIEAGSGDLTVNGQDPSDYFNNRRKWTRAVEAPLECLGFEEDIDVRCTTNGGGLTGQADAIKLGVARALVEMDENARPALRSEGHLTRDDRQVERKKINQPGARAKQQVSKR
jgi:small subunit ribosomal protein S9